MNRAAGLRALALALASTVMIACGGAQEAPPAADDSSMLTNSGYEGTWARRTANETSLIQIRRHDDGYAFRWSLESTDGKRKVVGTWDGRSEEFIDEQEVAAYRFEIWMDEQTDRLMVSCAAKSLESGNELTFKDFLVLESDGLALLSYTLERNGVDLEAEELPQRRYIKVADPGHADGA